MELADNKKQKKDGKTPNVPKYVAPAIDSKGKDGKGKGKTKTKTQFDNNGQTYRTYKAPGGAKVKARMDTKEQGNGHLKTR